MHRARMAPFGVAIALGFAASVSLIGCSSPPQDHTRLSEGLSESSSPLADSPSPTNATAQSNSSGKPATFPAEIPLIDGDIPYGQTDKGHGWLLVVLVANVDSAYAAAVDKFTNAGFTTVESGPSLGGYFGEFNTDKYGIGITARDSPEFGPSVVYSVIIHNQ